MIVENVDLHADALQILNKAWNKVKDRKNWCQRVCADDGQGRAVTPWHGEARRFCMMGAVLAITGCISTERDMDLRDYSISLLREAAQRVFEVNGLTEVNDMLGHDAVCKVFVRALQK